MIAVFFENILKTFISIICPQANYTQGNIILLATTGNTDHLTCGTDINGNRHNIIQTFLFILFSNIPYELILCIDGFISELGRMMLHFLFFPVSRVQGQRRLVSLTSWPQDPILRLKKSLLLTREVHANTHGCKLTVFCVMKLIL